MTRRRQELSVVSRLSRRLVGVVLATTWALGLLRSVPLSAADPSASRPPNVIFILADDLGYAELGCYGNRFNETPNLDWLAAHGMRFTQAYAAAPVCSPYRASLLTGQWPARVGITDYLRPDDPKHLSTDYVTLAEQFKRAGYATGLIGKWHLTGYANHGAVEVPPSRHGFDEVLVSENRGIAAGSYFYPYHFNREIRQRLRNVRNPETGEWTEYLTDRLNLEAVEFIRRHRNEPFFLYKSHYAVHTRLNGRPDLVARYSKKPGAGLRPNSPKNNVHLAAMLEAIDEGVGQIVATLRELGLLDHTIIVFTSDNGGEARVTDNGPLRGGKSMLYEGGIREPLLIFWPGVVPAGSTCNTPVCSVDFYPTFLDVLQLQPPKGQVVDGVSLLPLLKDPRRTLPRTTLYWHYPLRRPHFLGGRSSGAIRDGDWKLIEYFDDGHVELYNLANDLGEQHDLAQERPDKVAALRRKLAEWRKRVGAKVITGPKHVVVSLAGRRLTFDDFDTQPLNGQAPFPRRFPGRAYLDLPRSDAPAIAGRSLTVSARVSCEKPDGVVFAYGGNRWGFALYVRQGRPAAAVCVDWKRTVVHGNRPLSGPTRLTARLTGTGRLELLVDGETVASEQAAGLLARNPGDSIQVGADTVQPVGDYRSPNYFHGTIYELDFRVEKPGS